MDMTMLHASSPSQFCTECGSSNAHNVKFCGTCGRPITQSSTSPPDCALTFPSDFGPLRKRVKTSRWNFLAPATIGKKPYELFPEFGSGGLDLNDEGVVDFIITDSHLIVSKSPPKSGVYKIAEATATNVMGLGAIGLFAGLSVGLLGEGYEKLFRGDKVDSASIATHFQHGQIFFIERSNTVCYEILYKEGIFSPTVYKVAIAGKFHHIRHGQIDIAFSFWDSGMHKALEASGWTLQKTGIKFSNFRDLSNALVPNYLDMPMLYEKLKGM